MPKINPRIQSIDDLLGVSALEEAAPTEFVPPAAAPPTENAIQLIPPQKIRMFRGHPFRLYEGERLEDMIVSITDNGILTTTIIRKIEPDEDGFEYEMLAGHNRQNVALITQMPVIPCVVKENLSDEDAWIYVIETNVLQRSFRDLLPSEKAAVLALRYSKMFSQGKRNDIIAELERLANPHDSKENDSCGHDVHKSKSRDVIGADYSLDGRSVARYVRINELTPELKVRTDNGEISIVSAVELSYLTGAEQAMVEAVLSETDYKLDPKKAGLLRSYNGRLTPELTEEIISGAKKRKPKSSTPPPRKLKSAIISKYFAPDVKQSEFERVVDEKMPVIIMEPLLGGKLATGLPKQAEEVFHRANPAYSPAAWGLRWLLDQPEVTVILSGMNREEQVADNLKTAEDAQPGMLTAPEREAYRRVTEIFRKTDKVPCTGCGYCQPCPHGVNIPGCFAAYNTSYSLGWMTGMFQYVTSTGANRTQGQTASQCVGCGACEKHCPQNIPIRENLKQVCRRMEPFYFDFMMKTMRKSKK